MKSIYFAATEEMKEEYIKRPDTATVDAWKVKPPCMRPLAFCSSLCQYWHECNGDDDEDE